MGCVALRSRERFLGVVFGRGERSFGVVFGRVERFFGACGLGERGLELRLPISRGPLRRSELFLPIGGLMLRRG